MNKTTKILSLITVTGIAFYAGLYLGGNNYAIAGTTTNSGHVSIEDKDFSLYWKALSILENKHPDAKNITSEERIWNSIEGLAKSYDDPYTTFFNPEQTEFFEESINGEFSGVGMEVGVREGFITVISPLKNSPAELSGVLPGDIITKIDETSAIDITLDAAIDKIRGPKGESVLLTISREGEPELLEIEIVRDIIEIASVDYEVLKNGEFLISINSFSEGVAEEFETALQEFKKAKTNKLAIDLRNNPGGYLTASVDIASWLIPQGKVIVTESFSEDSGRQDIQYRSKGYESPISSNTQIIVLVNEGSASASEIVAGALQEYNIAKLVGNQTFGKGSVQEYIKLDNKTALKVTVARWLTPLGNSISNNGLTPDLVVDADFKTDEDEQLEAALQLLQ